MNTKYWTGKIGGDVNAAENFTDERYHVCRVSRSISWRTMIAILVVIILCGLAAWAVFAIPVLPPLFKNIAYVVIVIFVVLYILAAFGLLGNDLYVPRVRTGP